MIESAKPILIIGGTGNYGRYIVSRLVAKKMPVRVLSRNLPKARQLLGTEPEIIEGDIMSTETVTKALQGAGGLIISLSTMNPKQIRQMKAIEQEAVIALLDQAQQMRVTRVVYISVYAIQPDLAQKLKLETASIKQAVEKHLAQSKLNWTILGAPPSMEIFFAMTRGKNMVVPGGGPEALPSVSPVDLGEIAAQAVLRDDLSGQRLRVPGPETLSFSEAARRISAVYGREVKFLRIPLILPKIAWWLTLPLTPFSNLMYFVHTMISFIKLLNLFPQELAAEAKADHQKLLNMFNYTPLTLEMEAKRRMADERKAAQ